MELLKALLKSKNLAARKRASGAVRNFSREGPGENFLYNYIYPNSVCYVNSNHCIVFVVVHLN